MTRSYYKMRPRDLLWIKRVEHLRIPAMQAAARAGIITNTTVFALREANEVLPTAVLQP